MGAFPVHEVKNVEKHALLDGIQDGYVEADNTGIISFANQPFVRSLGLREQSEVTGKCFWEFTRKQYERGIALAYRSVIDTGQPSDYLQIAFSVRHGPDLIGEAVITPVSLRGKVTGTRIVVRDVTHRYESEKSTAFQKDFLDALLQQAPMAIATVDKKKEISHVNLAFQRLFDRSAEETIGRRMEQFIESPELRQAINEYMDLRSPEPLFISGQSRKREGSVAELEIFIQPFFAGSINYGHLVFCNDVSNIRKAEAELVNATTAYRTVLDTLQDAYFEADERGFITYVNQPLVEATKYGSKDELIGMHFRHLVDMGARLHFLKEFKKLFETSEPVRSLQIPYLTKDGTRFSSEVVASPIIEDGRTTGTRGIIRDISARVKAEELLKKAKEAAETRARELNSLNRVAQQVSRSLNLQDILDSACRELTRLFPLQCASIALTGWNNNLLEVKAAHWTEPSERKSGSRRLSVKPREFDALSKVVNEKQIQILQADEFQYVPEELRALFGGTGSRTLMMLPLITRGETFGCIGLTHRDPGARFHPGQAELAETVTSQIAYAVENARLYAQTERALDLAERDLEIGREIQSGFFPHSVPDVPGWEISTFFQAARQVSGDFYDVYQIGERRLIGLVVADVCDKGVGAALFMVLLRTLIRSASEQNGNLDSPDILMQTITRVNRYVVNHHGRSNMFATLFMGILDPGTDDFHYINAGHEPALLIGPTGELKKELLPTGPAIGFSAEIPFETGHLELMPGELILSYTDGFSEARDMQCRMYSGERFIREARQVWPSAYSAVKHLEWEIFSHMGDQVQLDDLTLVGLRREGVNEIPSHQMTRTAVLSHLDHFRTFVETSCKLFGVGSEVSESLKLAADELCSNVIQYGYNGSDPGEITLIAQRLPGGIRLVIEDSGAPFNPLKVDAPDLAIDLEKRKIGGLGIHIAKEVTDELVYERKAGKNRVTLVIKDQYSENKKASISNGTIGKTR